MYKRHQQKESLSSHEVPVRPWSLLASNLFTWNGIDYLITIDSYFGWFEFNSLNSGTTLKEVIPKLKAHFSRFGIPDQLNTDNGPQYSSSEFKKLSKESGLVHKTSSPGYPQSNGLTERAVQTAKGMLDKYKCDGTDPHVALLNLKNTPRDRMLRSPAQLLQARRLKSKLPTATPHLNPTVINLQMVTRQLKLNRLQQKKYEISGGRWQPSIVV